MQASSWVSERIEALARNHPVVWVEDPYKLLDAAEIRALSDGLKRRDQSVAVVGNAYRLREFLAGIDPVGASPRFVVIDQSYTTRDPHLLPQDAKPSDLSPLAAPDWKPFVPAEARFRPTVRDFLVEATGFDDWPNEVNIFPYERLARSRPAEFIGAYAAFRAMGRTLTSDDLVVVGASAVLRLNLFELTDSMDALELAFHSDDRWSELKSMFNGAEQDIVMTRLRGLPAPIGDLFSGGSDIARAAVTALIVLKQHFPDRPGAHLPFVSPLLSKYSECDVPVAREPEPWFLSEEVPRYEKLVADEFLKHIRDALKLDNADNARRFGQEERLSGKLRSLVSFEIERPPLTLGQERNRFRLEHLVPEFSQAKADLSTIVNKTRPTIEGLRLKPAGKLQLAQFMKLFDETGFHLCDRLIGRLETLIYYITAPAREQWQTIPGFEQRWDVELRECREVIAGASKLRDELDHNFGRMLEERYTDIVPAEVLPTDLFYEKFIAERRRNADGTLKRAVVLVIDSMRLDIWREIVRPALETDYAVEETLGFALLPTETRYSRRSFFAGKTPGTGTDGKESDLLAQLINRVHRQSVDFEDLQPRRPGMAFGVRSKDSKHSTYAGVFDFPDVLSHEVDWDPHTLHEVQRPLVEKIRALLAEAGPDALVFITADHGHVLQERGAPVRIRGAVDGVGYRAAHVSQRIEGEAAARLFQFEARKLRHNATGWFVFPKPGSALRDADEDGKRFKPSANYRHGGLSMVEVVIPLACLRHRSVVARVTLTPSVRQKGVVAQAMPIEITVRADSLLTSPVFVTADQDGVESVRVANVSTTPQSVTVSWLPTSAGRRRIVFTALLAGENVGEATIDVDVAGAKVPQVDVARAKLAKLFGDE